MKRLASMLLSAFVAINILFADEKTKSLIKVEYSETTKSHLTSEGDTIMTKYDFILQVAPGYSCYYNPRTYYVDSLMHDPVGKLVYDQVNVDALNEAVSSGKSYFEILKKNGMMSESARIDFKDFDTGIIQVWDRAGDRYRYNVAMADLVWEIGDSIKNILGYECLNAFADYHGRKWHAWFAPDIPVQDGPWQLCGLPGLIMEAETCDGLFKFEIKGLQQSEEVLKSVFDQDKYFDSNRKAFLKMKNYGRQNRASQIGAMTGGQVNLENSRATYFDLIETDYH